MSRQKSSRTTYERQFAIRHLGVPFLIAQLSDRFHENMHAAHARVAGRQGVWIQPSMLPAGDGNLCELLRGGAVFVHVPARRHGICADDGAAIGSFELNRVGDGIALTVETCRTQGEAGRADRIRR